MKKDYLFAHKLVALTDRKHIANRDLYDIYWMFKHQWPIEEGIVKKRTNKSLIDYLKLIIKFIEKNIHDKTILDGLGQVLSDKQKIWTKENLKTELLFQIKNYIHTFAKP
jgi:hypothetical protein